MLCLDYPANNVNSNQREICSQSLSAEKRNDCVECVS